MPKSNFVAELVNAFNLNNYFSDRVNTNFTVKGQKIVGLFAYNTDVAEYLHRIGKEVIEQQYVGEKVVAGKYYNLNCFPFVLNSKEEKRGGNLKEVKLADSTNREVIRNLKVHLVNEFRRAVTLKVIALLEKAVGITEEEGHEWVGGTVKIGAMDKSNPLEKHYLYCIAFDGKYLEEEGYSPRTFELFKSLYIREFNSRLRECGLKSSDFYGVKDDMLYIKNIENSTVRNVAEYVREQIAFSFEVPGKECSKVENFKDILGDLIFKWTKKSIDAYGYDIFTDEERIESGNSFALIPLTKANNGQLESLKHKDIYKINAVYNKGLISNIRGKTAKSHVANCEDLIYAISNEGIAQLLPEIMQYPIAYNKKTGHFEFADDLENLRSRQGSFSPDLGSDGGGGNSPKSSVEDMKVEPPRQASEEGKGRETGALQMHHTIDQLRSLSAAAVDVDESEQGACGGSFSPESRMHGYYDQQTPLPTPIPSASDEEGSKSGSESPKKHGAWCKMKRNLFPKSDQHLKRSGTVSSIKSVPGGTTVTEKQPDPKQNNTFPTRKGRSNPTSQINSTLNEFSPQQTVDSGQRFIDAAALDAQENLGALSRGGLGRDSGRYSDGNRPIGSSQSSRESSRDSSPVGSDSGTSSRYSPSSEIVSPTAKRLTPSRETVV